MSCTLLALTSLLHKFIVPDHLVEMFDAVLSTGNDARFPPTGRLLHEPKETLP